MKKLCIAIALAGALSAPTLQAALTIGSTGTITINQGPNSVGSGGEFIISAFGGLAALGTFNSFCIEHNETFVPGGTYNATVANGAVNGGISGGNPDPVSMGTAWLYKSFRAGTLLGYNGGLPATAGDLQNAIWWQEGEITADQSLNPFITQIPNASWRGYNNAVNANGAWGVEALNVTYLNGTISQDQLVIVPEPTTLIAGALLLLPFGASTMRSLRKKA